LSTLNEREAPVTAEAASRAAAGDAAFRLLAEQLPDLIILAFDPELEVWAATGAALRARGWEPEEFIGLRLPEMAGGREATAVEARCRAALAGQYRQLEMAGHHDPSRMWTLHFVPLPDERGAVTGGMLICRDVTEQRRAEQLLRASRRQLADAQRIAQVGSWEWDLDTDELMASAEFCRIFGLPSGAGRPWTRPSPTTSTPPISSGS
jgi:PAS domain S-box-containing protein